METTENLFVEAKPSFEKTDEKDIEYGQTQLISDNLFVQKNYKTPKRVTFKEIIETEESPKLEIFTDTFGYERIIYTRISPLVYTEFNLPTSDEELIEELPLHSRIFEAQLKRLSKESIEEEIESFQRPSSQVTIKSRKVKPGLYSVELKLPFIKTAQLLVPFNIPRQIVTESVGNEVDVKIYKKAEVEVKSDDYNQLSTISFDKKPELKQSQASLNQESVTEEFVDAFDTIPFISMSQKVTSSMENLRSLNIQQVHYNELELKYAKKDVKSKKLNRLEQSRLCGSFEILEDVTLSDDVKRELFFDFNIHFIKLN